MSGVSGWPRRKLSLREDDADTALESVLEGALATATGQHLRLQHQVLGLQVCGDLLGLLARLGHSESVWKRAR